MPSSNILLFDANKANMMSDEQYKTNTQRLNGVQSGIASSQLQNKTLYQVSLVAYAIAQIMNQNGLNANDTAAVSAFVSNLSGTILQKVADLATTQQAQAGVATGKWMSPALVKTAINTLAAKSQNILSAGTKTAFGLGSTAVPDDIFKILANAILYKSGAFNTPNGGSVPIFTETETLAAATAALYGKGASATPDDIFQILANAALYKNGEIVTPGGITVPDLKVELGSYVGTGATGESNPNSLTLSFSPSLLIIYGESSVFLFSNNDGNKDGQTIMSAGTSSFGREDVPVTCNENVVSWYYRERDSYAVFAQMNFANSVYQYIAFSK